MIWTKEITIYFWNFNACLCAACSQIWFMFVGSE